MRKAALIFNYLAVLVLILTLFVTSTGTLQTLKYVLLIVAAYFLFRITIVDRKQKGFHAFNYLFMAALIIFALYGAMFRGDLYPNITWQFFVAGLVGLTLALFYKEPRKRTLGIKPPRKPIMVEKKVVVTKTAKKKPAKKKKVAKKKTTKKKATKKTTKKKKVTKKKTTKRKPTKRKAVKKNTKTRKKVAKKKKPIKRKVTKKKKVAKKKTTKKKATRRTKTKKTAKKVRKKPVKRVTTTYYG